MAMIEVKDLTKFYGTFKALNEINFSVEKGQITGLLGPNGAGKSTTLKVITCYLKPTSGTVTVNGIDVSNDSISVREKIGYLPENNPLYMDMLVYDFLKFISQFDKNSKKNTADKIHYSVKTCGLTSMVNKKIQELSKGYRQRVGLAAALINDPEIVILDEPTSGLDPNQIIEIRELIKEIGKSKTIILSTHILPEVEVTCDKVIIINKGNIIADGSTVDLLKSSGNKTVNFGILANGHSTENVKQELLHNSAFRSVSSIEANDKNVLLYHIIGTSDEDIRPILFNVCKDKNWTCVELHHEKVSLEDRFRQLTLGE